MSLTRPRLQDLDTNVEYFKTPQLLLNQGSTRANVDVGLVFNRNSGWVSNVAIFWNEGTQSMVTAYTSSSGLTHANLTLTGYANVTVGAVNLDHAAQMASGTITNVGTGDGLLDSWSTSAFRGGKYVITTTDNVHGNYQITEVLILQDGINADVTSYGVLTNLANANVSVMTFSANVNSGVVGLWGTGTSSNNTVRFQRTLISAS
jgi:hypothetical protein